MEIQNEVRVINGYHRGIGFSIKRRPGYPKAVDEIMKSILPEEIWTFYLRIKLDQVPEEIRESLWLPLKKGYFPGMWDYDYHESKLLNEIEFHGGLTFYAKHGEKTEEADVRVIEVGCDFAHLGDEKGYTQEQILEEVKKAIDSFYRLVPDYSKEVK